MLTKKVLQKMIGTVLIGLGIVGLFLPVLQGILFILIGLAVLFPGNHHFQQVLAKARCRYPEQAARLDALRGRIRARMGWRQ